jgi:hypothetical protein
MIKILIHTLLQEGKKLRTLKISQLVRVVSGGGRSGCLRATGMIYVFAPTATEEKKKNVRNNVPVLALDYGSSVPLL